MRTSSEEKRIVLTFENFEIEAHNSGACIYDYVEISCESFIWKYCGKNIPGPFISSGTSMNIKFHSDLLGSGRGFLAKWTEINSK